MKHLDKMTPETIVSGLVNGEININELDLHKSAQREAFKLALRERPNLLAGVQKENEAHFFKYALENNAKYFIYLKREQYTDDLAQIYISKRLDEQDGKYSGQSLRFIVQKSLNNKLVFNCSYATSEGEELYYFDPELMVPVSIKSSFKVSLKLVDAVKLIDKLDTNITQFGAYTVYSAITDLVINGYKQYLNSYIKENNAGYYTLCTSFEELGCGFTSRMNDKLREYGLFVNDFKLGSLVIPKDIQYKIEDQAFSIRQRKADVQAEAEMANISLENYAAKLALQQKYPDADHSLTEFEKDLALKRYLIKNNRLKTEELDRGIDIDRENLIVDDALAKKRDIVPEIAPKSSGIGGKLAVAIILGAILTIVGFTMSVILGILFLISTIMACIVIEIMQSKSEQPTEPNSIKDTENDEIRAEKISESNESEEFNETNVSEE